MLFNQFVTKGPLNIDRAFGLAADFGVKEVHVLAITGRCGSSLFTHLCQAAKIGECAEIFNDKPEDWWRDRCRSRNPEIAIANHLARSAWDGKVLFQIDHMRLKALLGRLALEKWPDLRVSHLYRRNVIAQAISYHNAAASGLWHQSGSKEKRLDPRTNVPPIEEYLARILEGENFIRTKLPENNGTYWYEDLVSGPAEMFADFLNSPSQGQIERALKAQDAPTKIPRAAYVEQYLSYCNAHPEHAQLVRERNQPTFTFSPNRPDAKAMALEGVAHPS